MMKKKLTTIVLALLMTMMFATAGVFAAPENNNENSDYWKVEATEVTDSSVVLVWNPAADKDYKHSKDAVFNIYKINDEGDKELIAEVVDKETVEKDDQSDVYIFNDDKQAKDASGKDIPLGYSYTIKSLAPDSEYELSVEKVEKEDSQNTYGSVEFTTNPAHDNTEGASGTAYEPKVESGDKSLTTTAVTYTLSSGKVSNVTNTTAVLTWSISPEFTSGTVDINGWKVNPAKNKDGTYSYKVTGFDPAHGSYSIPVKIVDNNGKTISNILNISASTSYKLSTEKVIDQTATTAVFNWKMNRALTDGSKIDINGWKVNPTLNKDGTYSYRVTGFDPARSYTIPVKVVDKNGKTISNVMQVSVGTYYQLSAGKTAGITTTTAVLDWKMNRELTDGAKIDINGWKVNPTKNKDGTYSYKVTGFDPTRSYKIPVKVVDKNGKTISNVMQISVNTSYKLSEGKAIDQTPTTAVFNWKIDRELSDGARIDINGWKVNPTKNKDGTYSYKVTGFDPTRSYKIPVKVVDKNGKTISNVMQISVGTYYQLSAGKATNVTKTSAIFNWKMNRELTDGAKVDINGWKVNPTKNKDGTYSYNVVVSPGNSYKVPVKVVDKNGKALSNVMYVTFETPYLLWAGKATSISGETAVLKWKLNYPLTDGDKIDINGYKVTPTKNSDGTYSYKITGVKPGITYNIPVKVVDKNGKTVSNTIYIVVDTFGTIKTMQLSITFGETVPLTDHTDGRTTTTFRSGFTTTTVGSEGNEDTGGFYYFKYNGKLYRVKWTRISSVNIASSAFDKTYSAATATNYVNSLNISSSTGMLIWVNTYTQKEYIFTGSRNNWRLVAGPWSVTTGKASTPTQTGLGTITDKDPEQNGLPYWSVVYTFSFHGKLSSWSLGYPQSNGCVRNSNDHAYYIYGNCPIGTAVYVY